MEQLEDALEAARGVAEREREAAVDQARKEMGGGEEEAAVEAGAEGGEGKVQPAGKKRRDGGCWFGWL